jgi:hypothetical protein
MSSLDLDGDVCDLETEWRQAYRACEAARADYDRVRDCRRSNGGLIDVALLRLERAEALKGRLMARIERGEDSLIDDMIGDH